MPKGRAREGGREANAESSAREPTLVFALYALFLKEEGGE